MGTITLRLDEMDVEPCERGTRVERTLCECCHGTGVLEGLSIKDPRVRECEYCDGRGWWPVLPVPHA